MKHKKSWIKTLLAAVLIVIVSVPLFILLTTFAPRQSSGDDSLSTLFPPVVSDGPDEHLPSSPETDHTAKGEEPRDPEEADTPAQPPKPTEPHEPPEPTDEPGANGEHNPGTGYEPPGAIDLPVVSINNTDEELSELLAGAASRFNSVAVSLASFDRENGYFTYQYGYADVSERRLIEEQTKIRVASLTKLVVVILAMNLVESGKLDLDTDISTYLGYAVRNPHYPGTPITTRMLMQHTSSLYDTGAFRSGNVAYEANTTRNLLNDSTVHRDREPGTQHEYSDFAYTVLGAVCESVSGKLLDTLAGEVLFAPLGIDAAFAPVNLKNKNLAALYNSNHAVSRSVQAQLNHSASGVLGHQHNLAVGNLTVSTLDYARILNMLINGGVYNGVRVLSEKSVNDIHNTNVAAEHYEQGLSVRYQEEAFMGGGVYWHTGSAYGTFAQFMYCIDTGRIVVVVATGVNGEREPNGMIKACLALAELVW